MASSLRQMRRDSWRQVKEALRNPEEAEPFALACLIYNCDYYGWLRSSTKLSRILRKKIEGMVQKDLKSGGA